MLIRVSEKKQVDSIIDYIGNSYKTTPYLYVNIIKYGMGTEKVKTWIDQNEEDKIEGVYMLYYDCIHFFTNNISNYQVEKLIEFIHYTDHKVVMLQGAIGDRVESFLSNYQSNRNHIVDMDKIGFKEKEYLSEIGGREDIPEIVDLLMADPVYAESYDRKVMLDQFYDRFDSGFSRFFVIKTDGKVVASCNTKGEVSGFALIGGVIVHPDFRRRGFASDVVNYACSVLSKENISKVSFINYHNIPSLALHEKLGAFPIATLAKFVMNS